MSIESTYLTMNSYYTNLCLSSDNDIDKWIYYVFNFSFCIDNMLIKPFSFLNIIFNLFFKKDRSIPQFYPSTLVLNEIRTAWKREMDLETEGTKIFYIIWISRSRFKSNNPSEARATRPNDSRDRAVKQQNETSRQTGDSIT